MKKKGQLTHRCSTLTVNLGFLIALDYARLLMCEKRPMWHRQIFPRLSNIPFSFPMITHAYIGLVYFSSFFLFSISFFVEWAFNGAIELLPEERFFILLLLLLLLLCFFFLRERKKKWAEFNKEKRTRASLASGHIWSPHDVSFFFLFSLFSKFSLVCCPSSLLW